MAGEIEIKQPVLSRFPIRKDIIHLEGVFNAHPFLLAAHLQLVFFNMIWLRSNFKTNLNSYFVKNISEISNSYLRTVVNSYNKKGKYKGVTIKVF